MTELFPSVILIGASFGVTITVFTLGWCFMKTKAKLSRKRRYQQLW